MNILIGGAWPYANGSLHIGHIAGLIAGDVLARYHRQKGDNVCYVSGSDCYGTPIAIRAQKENTDARELSDFYHDEFIECFERLGFSYDMYGKTSSPEHESFVKEFHRRLYESESVIEKTVEQAYCRQCERFLPDRFVNGGCPVCGKQARGDQCEACGTVFESFQLINPVCAECGREISQKPSVHLFLKLNDFHAQISDNINESTWRKNAVDFTRRYLDEGLHERALTRDLDWGIDVPKEGFNGKKIYIWAENVLGYLSMCKAFCERTGRDFAGFSKDSLDCCTTANPVDIRDCCSPSPQKQSVFQYYVHGKDNIPFHSIILPALLLAYDDDLHLPDAIISSEFITLDGKKISTSANHAVWIKDLTDKYNPDTIRYFFLANSPEKRDADFSTREFVNNNNGELLGVYGNFVNRTLVFIEKYYDLTVPAGKPGDILSGVSGLFERTGASIEKGSFKEAVEDIFNFLRTANKYYDTEKPWLTRTSDPEKCADTIFNCVQIIANAAVLLEPFIPFSSQKIYAWLSIDNKRKMNLHIIKNVPAGLKIHKPEILFERLGNV